MSSGLKSFAARRGAWVLLGLTLLLVLVVRVRLRQMPLERDEGEYAYAGQLILHGVPPYQAVYNMKLPGTYAAYAVIMAVFGQTPAGIHLGVMLVNLGSIVLVFLLGCKLLDRTAGVVAAVIFALMSLSPYVYGLAAHATQFVTFFALAGVILLLRAEGQGPKSKVQSPKSKVLAASGLLFGLAFLMKQHGIFFGVFGLLYLARIWRSTLNPQLSTLVRPLAWFSAGFVLPYTATCLILWAAGVFPQFWFWTVSYAAKYASSISAMYSADMLRNGLRAVVGPNLGLWLLPWAGALVMWWEERLEVRNAECGVRTDKQKSALRTPHSALLAPRFFLTAFFFCSVASISVGFYFREHYFITLLPALALLSGVAVSRALHLLRHDKTIELFLAVAILFLFAIGLGAALIGNSLFWFSYSPVEEVNYTYGTSLFTDAVGVADYLRTNAPPSARVAVLGSEPELFFYSGRRSATGYIYMYPLMEHQSLAATMQRQMIEEIERAKPEYAVYVDDDHSWLPQAHSDRTVLDWWNAYWPTNMDVVLTRAIQSKAELTAQAYPTSEAPDHPEQRHYILVLKRK